MYLEVPRDAYSTLTFMHYWRISFLADYMKWAFQKKGSHFHSQISSVNDYSKWKLAQTIFACMQCYCKFIHSVFLIQRQCGDALHDGEHCWHVHVLLKIPCLHVHQSRDCINELPKMYTYICTLYVLHRMLKIYC